MEKPLLPERLKLGTSSFSSPDWVGPFYPPGTRPAEFLTHYAGVFPTVEIDATWYAPPSAATVEAWARRTPPGFLFSLKVPKAITHDAYLENCRAEWTRFLERIEPLGEKRGPLLFQFPYVAKGRDPHEYETGDDFRRRLGAFLPQIPAGGRYAVEVRNARWLDAPLIDLLRPRGIALALVAYYTLPRPEALLERIDPVTASFGYLRFIGDHKRMDALVREKREREGKSSDWDEIVVDRSREMRAWVDLARALLDRWQDTYAYFNNHFAGFAPGSAELFARLWREAERNGRARPD